MHYVARFATSSGKLAQYLKRKLRERGWEGEEQPDIEALVQKFSDKGYVDDEAYARMKSSGLLARGYGARRIEQKLRADGLPDEVRSAQAPEEKEARLALFAYLKRRRFGPFANSDARSGPEEARKLREKQLAAIVRAGHGFDHARRGVEAATIAELEEWVAEAGE